MPGPRHRIRLVATDLDGTLLDPNGQVSQRTADAVRAARQAGIAVIPVTARPPHMLWEIVEQASLGPFGVCCNGAVTLDVATRAVVESTTMALDISERIVASLRTLLPGITFSLDDLMGFTHERDFFTFELPLEWQERTVCVEDISSALSADCIKLIARMPGWSARQLLDFLESEFAEEAHLTTSGLDWVDIGMPGITKAFAVERVCARLGIGVDEVVAVGDNHNDLSVLAWAGVAAAPANAIPEVLAAVDWLLPSNAEDGIAMLLEELTAATRGTA